MWAPVCTVTLAAETLSDNLKVAYIGAVFAQDTAYFDVHGSGEIVAKATQDLSVITKGLGEKVGFLIRNISYACAVSEFDPGRESS